jgi:ABC-type branched-subunit amino acid transport system substrate-binding protein
LIFAACQSGDDDAVATAEARAAAAEAEAAAAESDAAAAAAEAEAAAAEAAAAADAAGAAVSEAEAAAAAAEAEAAAAEADAAAAEADAAAAGAEAEAAAAAAADAEMRAAEAEAAAAAAALQEGCDVDLTGETVYIHQQAGREGPLASILGDAFAFATEDAVGEVNDAGGICGATLEVIFRETNYNVDLEIAAYEEARAADPKPAVILTYASAATVALNERVIEDEIVNLAAGLNAQAIYVPRNGYTFAAAPIYSDQFAGFGEWLLNNWDEVKPASAGDDVVIGVIGWASAFGAGATTPESIAYLEGLGVTVLPLEEQAISPDADVTGQMQNLLLQGANVIYSQNLSFGTVQVIATARALGIWDDVIVGGVNWTNNVDVTNILGENAPLQDGYYAIYPQLDWNDVDEPGVQQARATFGRSGRPDSDRTNTYLLTYTAILNTAQLYRAVVNEHGLEGLTGANVLAEIQKQGVVNPTGILGIYGQGEDRSARQSQIRRATWTGSEIVYEVVQDFFELPDTRPPAP